MVSLDGEFKSKLKPGIIPETSFPYKSDLKKLFNIFKAVLETRISTLRAC